MAERRLVSSGFTKGRCFCCGSYQYLIVLPENKNKERVTMICRYCLEDAKVLLDSHILSDAHKFVDEIQACRQVKGKK